MTRRGLYRFVSVASQFGGCGTWDLSLLLDATADARFAALETAVLSAAPAPANHSGRALCIETKNVFASLSLVQTGHKRKPQPN